jgi:subtilase family serine protease
MHFVHNNSRRHAFSLRGALFVAILVLMVVTAGAADAETYAPLNGNHLDAAADLAAQGGAATAQLALQMEIYLAPRNQAQLDQLLEDQQDPTSSRYHQWLTTEEYDEQFGPTDADVAEVSQWLTDAGFKVTFASAHERRIRFTGEVATAQAAFRIHMVASPDRLKFANLEDPQVPAEIAPKISHLAGLENLHGTMWNTIIPDPPYNTDGFTMPYFGPPDIHTFSDAVSLLGTDNGSGQCIAVSEGSEVDQASLSEFNTVFGLPAFSSGSNFAEVYPDGSPGAPGSEGSGDPYGEAMLDVEYAHGTAPGAEIVVYAANAGTDEPDPAQALVDTAMAAVTDTTHHCHSLAISWAQCGEAPSFYTNLETNVFKVGAAEGQSIFVATGDLGTAAPPIGTCSVPTRPAPPNIEENAASVYVTAVGASMFTPTYTAGNDTSTASSTTQNPWSFNRISKQIPFLAASGATTGGYSKIFPKPSWQTGVAGIGGKFRAVPDLVLGGGNFGGTATITENKKGSLTIKGSVTPSPGFWECLDFGLEEGESAAGAEFTVTGGTSIVPPQYAGILAIINQKTGASGQGLINPKLYAMAQANIKDLSKVGIFDITKGKNTYSPLPGYAAKRGYDLASGWGAIDITNFVDSFISFVPPPPKK